MGDVHQDKERATVPEYTVCSGENVLMNSPDCSVESCLSKRDSCSGETGKVEVPDVSVGNCISMSAEPSGESSLRGLTKSSVKVAQKPPVAYIYREDIIQSAAQECLFGIVTKVAGDSDLDSSSDNEDQDDPVSEDHARIIWTNLEETTEKIGDIVVADRSFLHGDIVAAVSDPSGQTGTVVNVHLSVDLKTPGGEIKTNISSKNLRRIRAFAEGDYVLHGPWLGRVVEVVDNVTVSFDDGSKCKISRADPERLMPISRNLLEDTHYPYHPGQRVQGSSSLVFKNARWLRGAWKASRMEGTVSNVEVGSVYIYWIAATNPSPNSQSTTIPADIQDPKQLKLLSCFAHVSWQLGDWCLLQTSGSKISDVTATAKESVTLDGDTETLIENDILPTSDSCTPTVSGSKLAGHDGLVSHCKKLRKRRVKRDKKVPKKEDVLEWALLVVNTKTKVDVLWQDGTRSLGVDSKILFPVDNLGDHDFWPEHYVLEKGSDEDGGDSEAKRVGIVKSVDSKERTARVRWLKPMACPEDPREFDREEVVSVYELSEHPDYNYCIGDIVIQLSPFSEASEGSGIVHPLVVDKECEIEAKLDNHTKTELSLEQRALRKRQKAKVGVSFEDQSGDDKEFEHKSRRENDTKYTDPSSERRASRKRQKGKVGMSFEQSDLSSIGNITGLKDGDIEVLWANGTASKVGPQAIFVVGRDDDLESTPSSFNNNDNDDDDAASWETVDDNTLDILEPDEQSEQVVEPPAEPITTEGDHDVGDTRSAVDLDDHSHQCNDGGLSISRAAFGFVARLATGLLGFRGSKSLSDMNSSSEGQASQKHALEEIVDGTDMSNNEGQRLKGDSQCHLLEHTQDALCMEDGVVAVPEEREAAEKVSCRENLGKTIFSNTDVEQRQNIVHVFSGSSDHDTGRFKHFDSVKDPVDHYFLNETAQNNNERKRTKKIQQEWNILEKNLPETIYVRVYENRMDLLRAVIIGASGTPYQDGLFFFDIYLPPAYPDAPPAVNFHSRGLKVNPNLYETGKICLSLLNTWSGRGNEVWDPKTSSILQVLVSLQGLVLNARPYFNEAGYDKQIGTAEGEKNSLAYNENSFLLSCKLMLYLLHRPPKHFENFVRGHFQRRSHSILDACDAYLKGAEVGSPSEVPSNASSDFQNNSSAGFQLILAKLIPKLESAFRELGTDDC
eukprot:Gb_00082 [translate_table: standard]